MAITSPFPGMDPYLEQHWRDVHHRLITYACDQLQDQMPSDLRARLEERVFVESGQGTERSMYPDIRVIERGRGNPTTTAAEAGTALAEPLVIHLPDEPATQGYIEIIDVGSGNRVITVVEVLSVTNKQRGEGQELYLRKQRELKDGRVSLVEIDLLRAGHHVLAVPLHKVPESHRTHYMICVRRGWSPATVEVYRAPLRAPLPTIKVPLRETDQDVSMHLQTLIEQCYRHGGYDDLDYRRPPEPPLEPADAQWADELLRGKGLR